MKKVSALFLAAMACEESQNTDFDSGFEINPQLIDGEAPFDGEDDDSSDDESSDEDSEDDSSDEDSEDDSSEDDSSDSEDSEDD